MRATDSIVRQHVDVRWQDNQALDELRVVKEDYMLHAVVMLCESGRATEAK